MEMGKATKKGGSHTKPFQKAPPQGKLADEENIQDNPSPKRNNPATMSPAKKLMEQEKYPKPDPVKVGSNDSKKKYLRKSKYTSRSDRENKVRRYSKKNPVKQSFEGADVKFKSKVKEIVKDEVQNTKMGGPLSKPKRRRTKILDKNKNSYIRADSKQSGRGTNIRKN